MHLALQIDEILELIISIIDAKSDLLHLALTCKGFKDLALDRLWNRPMEIRDVLCPFFAWGVIRHKLIYNYGVIWVRTSTILHQALKKLVSWLDLISNPQFKKRDFTQSDIDRYRPYARRVVSVHLRWYNIDTELLLSILRVAPNPFPRLHTFSGDAPALDDYTFLTPFLPQSLRILSLEGYGTPQLCLRGFRKHARNLEVLRFSISTSIVEAAREMLTTLEKMVTLNQGLKFLGVRMCVPCVTNLLGRLSSTSIEQLDWFQDDMNSRLIPGAHPEKNFLPLKFPMLHSLTVDVTVLLWHLPSLLSNGAVPRLKSICFISPCLLSGNSFALPCLKAVEDRVGLEKVELRSRKGIFARDLKRITLVMAHLRPLIRQPLANLIVIKLTGEVNLDISNEELVMIGHCNHRLEEFMVGVESAEVVLLNDFDYPEPRIDLIGLILFTREVRELKRLRLSIKVLPVDINVGDLAEEDDGLAPALESWDISASKIERPKDVAIILAKHLPNIKTLTSTYLRAAQESARKLRQTEIQLRLQKENLALELLKQAIQDIKLATVCEVEAKS